MSSLSDHPAIRYVYDFAQLDSVPAGPTSARVTAKRLLSGPTLATGKSSTVGAVLAGEHLIVTLGRQARGSGADMMIANVSASCGAGRRARAGGPKTDHQTVSTRRAGSRRRSRRAGTGGGNV